MKIVRKLVACVLIIYAALLAASGLLGMGQGRLMTVGCFLMVIGAAFIVAALIRLLKKKDGSAQTCGIGLAVSWTGTCLVGAAGEFNILHHAARLALNALLYYIYSRVQLTPAEIQYAAAHAKPSRLLAPFRKLQQVPMSPEEKQTANGKKTSGKKTSHKRK